MAIKFSYGQHSNIWWYVFLDKLQPECYFRNIVTEPLYMETETNNYQENMNPSGAKLLHKHDFGEMLTSF